MPQNRDMCIFCRNNSTCYLPNLFPVLMEDLGEYVVQKTALIAGDVDKVAIQQLARNLGKVHQATHKATMSEEDFQQMITRFQWVSKGMHEKLPSPLPCMLFLISIILNSFLEEVKTYAFTCYVEIVNRVCMCVCACVCVCVCVHACVCVCVYACGLHPVVQW